MADFAVGASSPIWMNGFYGNIRHPLRLAEPAAAGPGQRLVLRHAELGLAVIFGLLNVINFAHGALYMLGAFLAWMGLSYWDSTTG
jgi:hypothetical protein